MNGDDGAESSTAESHNGQGGAQVHGLDQLDDLLVRVQRARQRPAYRRRVLEGIDTLDGIAGLRVLRAIERHAHSGARVTVTDVASDMGIGHSTASRAVDDVCKRGLAQKTSCTQDLRKARLVITDDGWQVLAQADANRQKLLARATQGWPPGEVARLSELLIDLLAGYDAIEASTDG